MQTMQTLIEVQDAYIAKVLTCTTGHIRRVRRGARNAAFAKLQPMGYTITQCRQIVADADDMADLERNAVQD